MLKTEIDVLKTEITNATSTANLALNKANEAIGTANTAFINSVKAVDISADRITAGTLNAANVNIVNGMHYKTL